MWVDVGVKCVQFLLTFHFRSEIQGSAQLVIDSGRTQEVLPRIPGLDHYRGGKYSWKIVCPHIVVN